MLLIAWDPSYDHPLPEGHRFPMAKYELLPEQLLREGTITEANIFIPAPATEAQILACHIPEYWRKLVSLELSPQEIRRTGFPLSEQLVKREVTIAGGTIQASEFARQYGISFNLAGGTHHAFSSRGEGFCLLNDQAMAAFYLLEKGLASRILIIDLDVHQGNGTAEIFREEPRVFTFSMHGGNNYPLHKEKSDLDLPLPDGTDDNAYLGLLRETLPKLFEQVQPHFVFYQAGVDVLATDKLGRLSLTHAGCKARDRLVLEHCQLNRVPVVVCMGGGYSERLTDILEAHANTYQLAQELYF